MLTLALARLTLPAGVGRRLNEGFGQTIVRGWLCVVLMLPELWPPEKNENAVLRYSASPRQPTWTRRARRRCARKTSGLRSKFLGAATEALGQRMFSGGFSHEAALWCRNQQCSTV